MLLYGILCYFKVGLHYLIFIKNACMVACFNMNKILWTMSNSKRKYCHIFYLKSNTPNFRCCIYSESQSLHSLYVRYISNHYEKVSLRSVWIICVNRTHGLWVKCYVPYYNCCWSYYISITLNQMQCIVQYRQFVPSRAQV